MFKALHIAMVTFLCFNIRRRNRRWLPTTLYGTEIHFGY